jgi:antitoxin (DNA-binding transcriptional repressor) of toxin-antitoxin stability system
MKRYTASRARESFAALLDEAAAGGSVLIERGDVQYVLTARRPQRRTGRRTSHLETIDPAVASGQWTWDAGDSGLRFAARRRS